MRLNYLLLLPVVGLVLAAQNKDDLLKKELARFKGAWALTAIEVPENKQPPADEIKKVKIEFTDEHMSLKVDVDKEVKLIYKLDTGQKPAAIDLTPTEGPDKGKTAKGVYQFDGDTLKICASEPGNDRPKEFKSSRETKTVLMVMKRAK